MSGKSRVSTLRSHTIRLIYLLFIREMEAHDDHQLEDQVPALVNGTSSSSSRVVSQEMCCYCFDVLLAHLTHSPPPRTAHFPNDE